MAVQDSIVARRAVAQDFSQRWQTRGKEKADGQSFWTDILRNVYGYDTPETIVLFEQGTEYNGWIDAVIPHARVFVEMKSRGKSLDAKEKHQGIEVTPYEQALRYSNDVPGSQRPRYIITSNFEVIRVHDLDKPRPEENYVEFLVTDLADNLTVLHFLEPGKSERTIHEVQVSWEAGEVIGKLYALLRQQYTNPHALQSQNSLNVLLVRLVFCLFAEDAYIFPKDALFHYLQGHDPSSVRNRLILLFDHLNTVVEERDKYNTDLAPFPYVNGGLFESKVTVPSFTQEIVDMLLNEASQRVDWSQISPTIFGGVFESTLNPETRKAGGMHYTSPQNIHRVIDPLFLDGLKQELDDIINMRGRLEGKTTIAQANDFRAFQNRISSLTFFDPACGSGNFLTETYIELRRLENIVLTHLYKGQVSFGFEDVTESPIKVSLRQFHGIEINDFAVSVAQTALWIAELQANQETAHIVQRTIDDLPLGDSANIVLGSAIAVDWNDIIPARDCNYIIGNPPFVVGDDMSASQKAERLLILGKGVGQIDYVALWFVLAARYAKGTDCEIALVATSSLNQGIHVDVVWREIIESGAHINFAHRAFTWANETPVGASVHVVIVGYSHNKWEDRTIIYHDNPRELDDPRPADNINAYLLDAPNAYIARTRKSPAGLPRMSKGFQPTDNGNLLISAKEYDEAVEQNPRVEPYIRRFTQARQFIIGERAYIIWLADEELPKVVDLPFIRERIEANREYREGATAVTSDAYKLRDRPHRPREVRAFRDNEDYLLVPRHTSHRRRYVPIGFVEKAEIVPGDATSFIPTADRFVMGMLVSRLFTLWLDIAGGRIREDYRFGSDTVYNTFPWAEINDQQRESIATYASEVIEQRRKTNASLDKIYNPANETFYPGVYKAHQELDRAVYTAYGLRGDETGAEVQTRLFELYLED